jgi:hypothetical protein
MNPAIPHVAYIQSTVRYHHGVELRSGKQEVMSLASMGLIPKHQGILISVKLSA